MRIGLFTDTYLPEINGVASSVKILETALINMGHDVFVITTKNDFKEIEMEGNILRLPGIELPFLYGYVLSTPFQINAYNIIKSLNLDIIHAHTEFSIGIFARIISKLLDIPLVSTYHTTYEDYTHYINFVNSKSVDNFAKKMVARLSKLYGDSSVEVISPSIKTKEMLIGYDIRSDIHVIPTGLDLDRFYNYDENEVIRIRKEFNINDELFVIYLGRIAEEKNIELVLKSFELLKKDNIKTKFVIVGAGPGIDDLKKICKTLDIEDIVIFAGKKSGNEVSNYYHSADIFVSASLSETQGLTFIEALASSLPIFAMDKNVLSEVLYDGVNGFYFDDENDLKEKIKEYIKLENKEELKKNAKESIVKFDSIKFGQEVYSVYLSAIKKYKEMYMIDDIKIINEHVSLFILSPNNEENKVNVSFDTYSTIGIRKGFKISENMYNDLLEEEKRIKAYNSCIKKLAIKDRTKKEIYDFITKNFELDIKSINDIVDRLESKGYIDDYRYANNKISTMKISLFGRNKIIKYLKSKGISYEIIEECLNNSEDDELFNALGYADKYKNSIKNVSIRMKKQKIFNKLIMQGYSTSVAKEAIDHLNLVSDDTLEIENLKKAAIKAKKRYEKTYSGTKLRNSIFRNLYNQGYRSEDIYSVLDEMEWSDEYDD